MRASASHSTSSRMAGVCVPVYLCACLHITNDAGALSISPADGWPFSGDQRTDRPVLRVFEAESRLSNDATGLCATRAAARRIAFRPPTATADGRVGST
jgi:hypothetical protein